MENKTLSLLSPPLCSYSMILVEIATRSDLISVSMIAVSEDYNLRPPFELCFLTSSPLCQDQAEGVRLDLMWRPPLPEVKTGKTDTDCPSQGDYCEVRHMCKSCQSCKCLINLICHKNIIVLNSKMLLSTLTHLSSSLRSAGLIMSP